MLACEEHPSCRTLTPKARGAGRRFTGFVHCVPHGLRELSFFTWGLAARDLVSHGRVLPECKEGNLTSLTSLSISLSRMGRATFTFFTFPGICTKSVQFSRSVVSDSLWPHESQHARPPCPSPSPGVHSDSHSLSQWCHPAISSSVVPFSSCPNPSQHQGLFQWVNSLHEVAKLLEFQLQHQSFQWYCRTFSKPWSAEQETLLGVPQLDALREWARTQASYNSSSEKPPVM